MIEVIQPFLAPAVMFSAGGLLCMAQFARLTAIIAHVRTFNRERLAALQDADQAEPQPRELILQRAQDLEHQAGLELAPSPTRVYTQVYWAADEAPSGKCRIRDLTSVRQWSDSAIGGS